MKDPYVYKNSKVLINKFNILDSDKLDKAESDFVIIGIETIKNFKDILKNK